MERQATFGVARPELGGARLPGDHDRQVDEVVRVADQDHVARGFAHRPEHLLRGRELPDHVGLEGAHHPAVGSDHVADHLGAIERPAIGERRVGESDWS
jgi:hypothetical protein